MAAEFSLEEIKQYLAHAKVPILTLDERYNVVMPDKDKTPEIRKLERKLNDALKNQGRITNDLKEVKKIKAKLIQDVVENMETDSTDTKRDKMMNQNQRLIQEAKEKIAELEDAELEAPKEIAAANMELLMEFIQLNYEKINENREDIEIINKWVNEIRVELKRKLVIKQEKETKNSNIYAYMHDLLGPKLIEMFDASNASKE